MGHVVSQDRFYCTGPHVIEACILQLYQHNSCATEHNVLAFNMQFNIAESRALTSEACYKQNLRLKTSTGMHDLADLMIENLHNQCEFYRCTCIQHAKDVNIVILIVFVVLCIFQVMSEFVWQA